MLLFAFSYYNQEAEVLVWSTIMLVESAGPGAFITI
jgi:hypothetical protein